MTACTTVYVLPQPDPHVVWVYPCAPHPPVPPPTGGVGGGGHARAEGWRAVGPRDFTAPRPTDDEDVALLIALGVL